MNPKNILTKAILAAAGVALSSSAAMAVNPNFVAGDLVVFFQQRGGTNTIMLDVGQATLFRDATSNILNIANIGTELADGTNGFGSGWANDTSLFWGAAGVRSSSSGTSTQVAGDPSRTIYASQGRTTLGTAGTAGSSGWSVGTGSATTSSGNILSMVNRLGTVPAGATDRLVEPTSSSNVDNFNPFLGNNPGTAFTQFTGGVESSFGAGTFGTLGGVNAESSLDLYRILATTNPAGTVISGGAGPGVGSFEGSFVVDGSGNVSYVVADVVPVPEPSMMAAGLALGAVATMTRRRRRQATATA